jgi:serine/threonine protein kinase
MYRGSVSIKIGQYVLDRTIGQGTFSKVKLATHEQTGKTVAIKIISKRKIIDNKLVDKVKREMKILKLFQHPHIIKL